jgi:hypothetical protein
LTRLKVGDGPDSRVPPVSARRKKKREKGAVLGQRVAELGHLGRCTHERKKKASGLIACGLKEKKGRERGRGKKRFVFFKFSFQIHFSNIQTSIKQNPCIRIMMHKHLLFLNYFSDV